MRKMILVLIAACSSIVGCGGGADVDLAGVSGVVKWDGGEPVADADIIFMPEDGGVSSTAKTDSSGNFSLRTTSGASGALIGKHKVTVSRKGENMAMDFSNPASLQQMAAGRDSQAGKGNKGTKAPGEAASAADSTIPVEYSKVDDTPLAYDVTADGDHSNVQFTLQK